MKRECIHDLDPECDPMTASSPLSVPLHCNRKESSQVATRHGMETTTRQSEMNGWQDAPESADAGNRRGSRDGRDRQETARPSGWEVWISPVGQSDGGSDPGFSHRGPVHDSWLATAFHIQSRCRWHWNLAGAGAHPDMAAMVTWDMAMGKGQGRRKMITSQLHLVSWQEVPRNEESRAEDGPISEYLYCSLFGLTAPRLIRRSAARR